MKLKRLILFGLLILPGVLNAQTDFRPGYIIKTTGDTIMGQIDYRGDLLMSSLCKFKDVDNTIKEYSPNDIFAFRFLDSKYYETREIDNKKVFMEYLIKGIVSIYYMRDEIGDHYYIDKEGVKISEIPYEEGIKYVGDKKVYYESTRHIGLLSLYMQDAPELQSRILTIKKPEHQSLIKLAEDYHNTVCTDETCIVYEKRLPLISISFEPYAGLTIYKRYDKYIKEFGGYLYFWAPRSNEKLFFKTGLSYQQSSEDGEALNGYKIPVQLQYIYRAHRIQPSFSAGVNFIRLKVDDVNESGLTFSLNPGLDYMISDKISFCTALNFDFTPISVAIMEEDVKFDIISYSVLVGLRIDL